MGELTDMIRINLAQALCGQCACKHVFVTGFSFVQRAAARSFRAARRA
jgi:hypothetical protein